MTSPNFHAAHGLTGSQQATLTKSDGGYEYTGGFADKVSVQTTLSGNINDLQTTITLTSSDGFAVGGGKIVINSEIISYTGISVNNLTGCTRAQNFTTATAHTSGDAVSDSQFGWQVLPGDIPTTAVNVQTLTTGEVSTFYVEGVSIADLTTRGFLSTGGTLVVENEQINYDSINIDGNGVYFQTLTRGVNGTTATSHIVGTEVTLTLVGYESGVLYTKAEADAEEFRVFSLDRQVHLASDNPYWSSPTPQSHIDKGLFGGVSMPAGVTQMFDFTEAGTGPNGEATVGSLYFRECLVGDLLLLRFDFNVIPQIANTTLEMGLWWQTRDPNTLATTFSFDLMGTPTFFGAGSIGRSYLMRPIISAYFASDEDVYAHALPIIRADNPIIIQPLAVFATIER